jgi:hypothetical protein
VQNTWEPFEPSINQLLEEKFVAGDSFSFVNIENETFLCRLDKMVMFHSESGYMVRLRRRRVDISESSKNPFTSVESETGVAQNPRDEHFNRVVSGWTEHNKSLLKEIASIFPNVPLRWCGQALIKTV